MSQTTARLRQELESKNKVLEDFYAKGIKLDDGNVEVKSADLAYARKILAEAAEIKSLIEIGTATAETKALLKDLNQPVKNTNHEPHVYAHKTIGELFVGSEEFKTRRGNDYEIDVELKGLSDITSLQHKNVYTDLPRTGASPFGFGHIEHAPLVERPQRPVRVRDLFPVANTDANLIQYIRYGNPTWAATALGQQVGGNFPQVPKTNLQFSSQSAPVRLITHHALVHRDTFDDEPGLAAVVNNDLLFGLSLKEDEEVLTGDGTGDHLLGLLNTPGIQVHTKVVGDSPADTIRRQKTLAAVAYLPANGVVLHPNMWEAIELTKAKPDGDGQYVVVTNVAFGAEQQVWRCRVVDTPVMPEEKILVANFGMGAQLYDRRQAAIRTSEHLYFDKNAVAVLADERLALTVPRPAGLVVCEYTL